MNNSTVTTQPNTIQEAASQLFHALQQDKRNDGSTFYKLVDGSPEWMTDVIRATHGGKLPDDTVYEFIERCAGAISDASSGNEDDLREAIYEMEPDVYTHDLTAWLHERVDHVYYLTQALEKYGNFDDGFNLLMTAQKMQIEEVGSALLDALRDFVGDQEIEEEDEIEEDLDTDGNLIAWARELNAYAVIVYESGSQRRIALRFSDFDYTWQGDTNVYPFEFPLMGKY